MGKSSGDFLRENKILREKLKFYYEYDMLTGLYNISIFYEKARGLLEENPTVPHDVFCVDVERFKLINDLYGPERGDALLRYLAGEMKKAFEPKGALLGRLSADVFALCLPASEEAATVEAILQIFHAYPLDMEVIPAIGIYHVEDRGVRVSLMCDRAVLALRSIKGNYMKHAAVYDSSLRNVLLEEQEILNGVDSALENKEFQVYFQPKVNMRTGKVVGAEALVRWQNPQKGLIPPKDFIPIFERNGFIKKLDMFIWEETAAWIRRWQDKGNRIVPVSVNISRIDVYGMDVCEILQRLVKKYRLEPKYLELEITESAYASRPEEIIRTLERLMGHGFTVLMDDFGSGYSSLNMLKDVNVDVLKIDMRFLDRDDRKSKDILESVVHMSKWLNLPVIAEGVESQGQVDFLMDIGCVYAQGFFYYSPMPLEDFQALLLDADRIDFEEDGKLRAEEEKILDFRDLYHKDVMSDRLLNNILGAIALYSFENGRLRVLRGSASYYRLVERPGKIARREDDIFQNILEEDRPLLLAAIQKARRRKDCGGAEVSVRQSRPEGVVWFRIRLFYLSENAGSAIFYAALSDVTSQMASMEALRVSEERFRVAMEATNLVIFELDVKSRTVRYSDYVQKKFGLNADVMNAPEGFIEAGSICGESEDDFRELYYAIYQGKEKASTVIHAKMGDGSLAWNRITLTAVRDGRGRSVKAVGLVENVTREIEMELRLGQRTYAGLTGENQRLLVSMLGGILPCGMIGGYLEEGFPLYFVNEEMIALLGYDSYEDFASGIGFKIANTILPEDLPRINQAVLGLSLGEEYNLSYRTLRKDKSAFPVLDRGRVIRTEDGRLAIVSVCLDLTERMELDQRLATVADSTPGDIAILWVDAEGMLQTEFLTQGLGASLGYESQEYREIRESGETLIYYKDLEKLRRKRREIAAGLEEIDFNFRVYRKDGGVSWVNLKASRHGEKEGLPVYHGIFVDMTPLKRREEELRLSQALFREALRHVRVSLWEYNFSNGRLKLLKEQQEYYLSWERVRPAVMIRKGFLHPKDGEKIQELIDRVHSGQNQVEGLARFKKEEEYRWMKITCTVFRAENREAVQAVGTLADVQEQEEREIQYRRLLEDSQRDCLTQLYNRAALQKLMPGFFERNQTKTAAFVLLDIDNFKQINDSYGHLTGDEVLCRCSAVLLENCSDGDLAVRLGGDEFVLLVSGESRDEICVKVDRICKAPKQFRFDGKESLFVSISAGIAFWDQPEIPTFSALYSQADVALYQAKHERQGENAGESGATEESLPYLDTAVLNELGGLVWITDLDSHELIYCNRAFREQARLKQSGHLKCYAAIQGIEMPCEDCSPEDLPVNEFRVRILQYGGASWECREKLLRWNGCHLRLAILRPLEEKER